MLYSKENMLKIKNPKEIMENRKEKIKNNLIRNKIFAISSILFIIFVLIDIMLIYNFFMIFQTLE